MQDYWAEAEALTGPRRARPPASSAGKRSAADCEREAADALAAIAARQHKFLLCGRNQSALDSIVAEFEQYLTELDNPGRDTWATCTDLEVLVFLEAHYLQNHDGAYGGDVAPGTLTKAVSTLRRAFNMRHRGGPWISEPGLGAPRGNPCDSLAVGDFQTSYGKAAQEAGVHEVSATPLPLQQFVALMHGLEHEIDAEWDAVVRGIGSEARVVRLCRDAAALSVLWASCRRGSDALNATWAGLHTAEYAAIVPAWLAHMRACGEVWPLGGDLLAVPVSTKTEKARRAGTWDLPATSHQGYGATCAVRQLQYLLGALHCARWPQPGTGYIFQGYCGRYNGVIGSTALAARLTRALDAYGVRPPVGVRQYTLHSFRRGRLQHEEAQGVPHAQLMRLSGIKSMDTLMRYLDKGRHL